MSNSIVSPDQNTEIDSIDSYFECITRCLEIHLKGGNQNE